MPLPITQWKDQEKAKARTRQRRRGIRTQRRRRGLQEDQMSPGRTDRKQPTAANGRHAATWASVGNRTERRAGEPASRVETPKVLNILQISPSRLSAKAHSKHSRAYADGAASSPLVFLELLRVEDGAGDLRFAATFFFMLEGFTSHCCLRLISSTLAAGYSPSPSSRTHREILKALQMRKSVCTLTEPPRSYLRH